LVLAAGPAALWHDVVVDIWLAFEAQPRYFVGWTPWVLMAGGVAFFVPVVVSAGQDPEGRFYPRARNAYLGWGVSLYLLGFLLAWQVARIHDGALTAS